MKNMIDLYNVTINQYEKLDKYIEHLQNEREYYSNNREILYTAAINRCYSLWETYNKNIVYAYYIRNKDELIEKCNLISKLKLNELPGYIVEQGKINKVDNCVYYELREELITFTSRNMDMHQLNVLYNRINVKIAEKLNGSVDIKEFLTNQTGSFITIKSGSLINNALKEVIIERNITSHSALIDNYKDLLFIKEWIQFFMLLIREITLAICNEIADIEKIVNCDIGEYKNYYKSKKVLCIDLYDNTHIKKNGLLGILKNNTLIDIVSINNIQIDDVNVDEAKNNDKVGIELASLFSKNTVINESSNIVNFDN